MALVLAGCEPGAPPFGGFGRSAAADGAAADGAATDARASPAFSPSPAASRDVEAPEAFSMTGEGLWDGRPSLGGIWVAHASVHDPERVVIRNPANGKSVVGALFRRERLNPGPSIQISSDAADALGLLAGQPAGLSIVALRREEAPAPAAVAAGKIAAPQDAPAAPSGQGAAAASGQGAAAAAASRPLARPAATNGPITTDPIAASAAAAIAKAEGADEAASGETAGDAATAATAPSWAERRALRRAERQAAREARAAAAADPVGTVTVTPGAGEAAAPALAAAAAVAPTAAPPASGDLRRAYVQIGIFSAEANATKAASQMRTAGLAATLRDDRIQGKPYWRVIVGPAASVAERDALAARVKAVGYPDAYPVQD